MERSPEPTRTVLVTTTGGGLSEQQVYQCSGGAQAVRSINAVDPQGSGTAVSFYNVRCATAFCQRVSKVPDPLPEFRISHYLL